MSVSYKEYIESKLSLDGVDRSEFSRIVVDADPTKADFCVPCFKFSKLMKKSPMVIAEELKKLFLGDENFDEVEAVSGYLNFKVSKAVFCKNALKELIETKEFGRSEIGRGKTICIDYSSVNIAKPLHIGHLSTTVIGAALYRIYGYLGYNVVGINHLGDYGTQFGKLISAYKRWGNREDIERGGVRELMKIYVKFHEEAEKDKSLEDEARSYFKQIEEGDKEALELFEFFKEITLKDVSRIYDDLGVKFDSYNGESFYFDKMDVVIERLKEKNLLVESDGAMIVDLSAYNMAPCIILRSDGASLYATRDLAAAIYRKNTYNFEKCLYVVAYQQNLHFRQIFKVLELMGYPWAKDMEHVAYGMVSIEGLGAMSTRKGQIIFLEDVLAECRKKAKEIILEKNPSAENPDETARMVGNGAVVFSALFNNKIKDIAFSYDRVLSFEGETGPYLQYTVARVNSLIDKAGEIGEIDFSKIGEEENALIKLLYGVKDVLLSVIEKNEPSLLTRRLIDIAKAYNKYYYDHRIMGEEEGVKSLRLALSKATGDVIRQGLLLLGIESPYKM